MGYVTVDAPNYRVQTVPPQPPNLRYVSVNIDRPNYLQPPPIQFANPQTLKQVSIMNNRQINVPLLWAGNNFTQPATFSWGDPSRTTINSAALTVRAFSNNDAMAMDIYMNNTLVGSLGWAALESKLWREVVVDVKAWLANGNNNFKIDYYFTFFGGRMADGFVYMDLAIDYTGDEPSIPPPKPPFDPTPFIWGGTIIIGGVLAYKLLWPMAKGMIR